MTESASPNVTRQDAGAGAVPSIGSPAAPSAAPRPGEPAPVAPESTARSEPPSQPPWDRAELDRLAQGPFGLRERYPNAGWIGLGLALVVAFFYLLAPILTPFALAGVLAYVLHPGVDWLERHHLPRALGSILMVVLCAAVMLGLVLILLPVLEREIAALDQKFPSLVIQANTRLMPLLEEWLGVKIRLDPSALRALAMQQVGQQDMVSTLLSRFGSGGLA